MTKSTSLFYITGLYGSIENGLGRYLNLKHDLIGGISLNESFSKLKFLDQLSNVHKMLADFQLNGGHHVIANSYGAYLFLHCVLRNPELSNLRSLLLSPVLGQSQFNGLGRIPPQALKLKNHLKAKQLSLKNCTILAGSADPVINWEIIDIIREYDAVQITIAKDENHQINPKIMQDFIDNWVKSKA